MRHEEISARRPHARPLREERSRTRQNNPKLGELAGLRIDLYRPAMLLDDDVVTDGKAQSGPFTGRFGREERVEHLLLHLGRNAGAVVANPDFYAIAEVFGRGSQRRLKIVAIGLRFTFSRRIEAVGDQVEQRPRNLLREQIDLTGGRVKGPFQGDS